MENQSTGYRKIHRNRKGFNVPGNHISPILKSDIMPEPKDRLVYWNNKLKHSGISSYKVFENFSRIRNSNSLKNLLNHRSFANSDLLFFIDTFNSLSTDDQKSHFNDEVCESLDKDSWEIYLKQTRQIRNLNSQQSKKCKSLVDKLSYYTQTREFINSKNKILKMKVAFLTLTAPESADNTQILSAFNHFLDYLQRTANCIYVWKKELGEMNSKLHFHVVVNNFIPYYIISWKWKRLLIAEGVIWPINDKGEQTSSHYRIELPRSKKQVSHYIAKYMSKAYDLPGNCGYVYGCSSVLRNLKEIDLSEHEIDIEEYKALKKNFKTISRDYTQHICCDLLHVKKIAPKLYEEFQKQYVSFSETITLTQRFKYVTQNDTVTNLI